MMIALRQGSGLGSNVNKGVVAFLILCSISTWTAHAVNATNTSTSSSSTTPITQTPLTSTPAPIIPTTREQKYVLEGKDVSILCRGPAVAVWTSNDVNDTQVPPATSNNTIYNSFAKIFNNSKPGTQVDLLPGGADKGVKVTVADMTCKRQQQHDLFYFCKNTTRLTITSVEVATAPSSYRMFHDEFSLSRTIRLPDGPKDFSIVEAYVCAAKGPQAVKWEWRVSCIPGKESFGLNTSAADDVTSAAGNATRRRIETSRTELTPLGGSCPEFHTSSLLKNENVTKRHCNISCRLHLDNIPESGFSHDWMTWRRVAQPQTGGGSGVDSDEMSWSLLVLVGLGVAITVLVVSILAVLCLCSNTQEDLTRKQRFREFQRHKIIKRPRGSGESTLRKKSSMGFGGESMRKKSDMPVGVGESMNKKSSMGLVRQRSALKQ